MVDPFKIIQDLNLTVGGRIGDDGYAYVDVNRVFGMIKGFFDTPLGLAIEKGEKDQLPLGDRYLNAMYYVQNARTPQEQEAAQKYLDTVGDMIDKQGGIVFPVNLDLHAAPAYTPEGWSPFQHNGAIFNPADGNARTRMTAGQAAGEFIAALDKYDAARGVQPDPQLRSRIGAVISIEEPVSVGPRPASYSPATSTADEPEATKAEPAKYAQQPDSALGTADLIANPDMPLADKVDAILNAPYVKAGASVNGVDDHNRLSVMFQTLTDYINTGDEAGKDARRDDAMKILTTALGDAQGANNYAYYFQQAYDRGNMPQLTTAGGDLAAALGADRAKQLNVVIGTAQDTAAAALKQTDEPTLQFTPDTKLALDLPIYKERDLEQRLNMLLSAEEVYVTSGSDALTPKERAEAILEALKEHVVKAGIGADGTPLEGDALKVAQEAALRQVGEALAGLDAKEQQNLQLLLQEEGVSLDGLNPELQARLQQIREAALDADGKAQTGSGQEFGFMQLIMAFIAMILPEGSEMRQKIETMIDGDKEPKVEPVRAADEPAATAPAVPAPEKSDTDIIINEDSVRAIYAAVNADAGAATDYTAIVGVVEAGLIDGTPGKGDGKVSKAELTQYASTLESDNPALDKLLKDAGIERGTMAVAEATEAAVQSAGVQQQQATARGA